ncbi:MAG: anthranilate phosphoribosyltransferase [Patescibacteria group bacterium]
MKEFLAKLNTGLNLSRDEAAAAMQVIMSGGASEAELEEYLVLLAEKGETADEIAGSAHAMRENSRKIFPKVARFVDIVGTGGDCSDTFNISTTAAFVVAGAGVAVAKHGNKAVSSKSGAANVLEALGVKINLEPERVEKCIEEVGIGFLFAPIFHPAMKYAAPVRAKLKRKTIFNLLGPLTNPAGAKHLLIGVFEERLAPIFAEVLRQNGVTHALVVHGDGLDEFSTTGKSTVFEVQNEKIAKLAIDLAEFGIQKTARENLRGGDATVNAQICREILAGESDVAKTEIVILNAGAAIFAADAAPNLAAGIAAARQSLESGAAEQKLKNLIEFTNQG